MRFEKIICPKTCTKNSVSKDRITLHDYDAHIVSLISDVGGLEKNSDGDGKD